MMRKSFFVMLLALFVSAPSFGQDTVKNNQNKYMPFLSALGLEPVINSKGNIRFTHKDLVYFVETQSPEYIFSIVHYEDVTSVTEGKGCFDEFNQVIYNTMTYFDSPVVRGVENCELLAFRWFFDLPAGQELTPDQLFSAIQRINNGVSNAITEIKSAGLID